MTSPVETRDVPTQGWTSTFPSAPPYVEGPLSFPDPLAPAPQPVERRPVPIPVPPPFTVAPAAPAAATPARGRAAAVFVALAVVLFLASVLFTRSVIVSTSTTANGPAVTTPTTRTPPSTARRSVPSTALPSQDPSGSPSTGNEPIDPSDPSGGVTPEPESSSPADEPDLTEQAAVVTPGIVNIVSRLPAGVGAGTGIIISATGDVVTNNHVIEGATQIQATLASTGEVYTATVVGTDPTHDVALLHLAGAQGLPTVPIGDSDAVQVGDEVAAVGNAGGLGGAPDVAGGRVIALHQPVTAADETGGQVRTLTDLIQVDAFVQPGDSGGPLVDANAKVIGIDVAAGVGRSRTGERTHVGFAIPINRVMSIAAQIRANPSGPAAGSGTPTLGSGYLGVSSISTPGTTGAVIQSVQPRSPASGAGLQTGDVITQVDDTTIASADELVDALARHRGGDTVTISWLAADGAHQAPVTLASR